MAVQELENFVHFRAPFCAIVAGPSSSGKTVFARKFIDQIDNLVAPKILDIFWHYPVYQKWFSEYENKVTFIKGLPNPDTFNSDRPSLRIVDDMMSDASKNTDMQEIFTRFSHHTGTSVLFLVQNFFAGGQKIRTMTLNAQYLIFLKNARDKAQIATLGRQVFPGQSKFFKAAYDHALNQKPYSYLILDLHSASPDNVRLKTNIFKDEHPAIFYSD